MTSVSAPPMTNSVSGDGLRPVNLRTDLAALADLIELVFAPNMDENGRAAIREMRYLSRMGVGLSLLGRMNEMTLGISLGYVWIADGRLVGNTSIYPANWPPDLGSAWIIANVAVHPDYQGRGIAHRLMEASLGMIRERGGTDAILQVDIHNERAIPIYDRFGFIKERAWTTWWRNALPGAPPPDPVSYHITRRRPSEWRQEYALAQRVRPAEQGGIGWLKPIHPSQFHRSIWRQISDWFSMGGLERLVIRDSHSEDLLASLWVETGIASSRARFTLLAEPLHDVIHALLSFGRRRFYSHNIVLEHPDDDSIANEILRELRFRKERTVWHMRLTL